MMLRTYQAATMAEALAEVKRELGRDAVILHTRSVRKGGVLGLFGGRCLWEVTASPNINVPHRVTRGRYVTAEMEESTVEVEHDDPLALDQDLLTDEPLQDQEIAQTHCIGEQDELVNEIAPLDAPSSPGENRLRFSTGATGTDTADLATETAAASADISPASLPGEPSIALDPKLHDEVKEIKRMMEALIQNSASACMLPPPKHAAIAAPAVSVKPAIPERLRDFHEHLLRQDVEESVADELIHQLKLSLSGSRDADSKMIADRLCDLIASRIATGGPVEPSGAKTGKPRVIALVGPTGVGKTTTIAKLAAELKLRRNQRVGLVTIDTYRIAAVDQLRAYAEIIEVPIRTVLSAGELHTAVYGMNDVDAIIIDTAGRSQNDQPRLNQLQMYLATIQPDEVHLVMSATSNRRCMRNILTRFGGLGVNRIILTKLDEAETFGTMLSFSAGGAAPLSFVTTGQDVPDDIEPADAWRLAQRILKGVHHVS